MPLSLFKLTLAAGWHLKANVREIIRMRCNNNPPSIPCPWRRSAMNRILRTAHALWLLIASIIGGIILALYLSTRRDWWTEVSR